MLSYHAIQTHSSMKNKKEKDQQMKACQNSQNLETRKLAKNKKRKNQTERANQVAYLQAKTNSYRQRSKPKKKKAEKNFALEET